MRSETLLFCGCLHYLTDQIFIKSVQIKGLTPRLRYFRTSQLPVSRSLFKSLNHGFKNFLTLTLALTFFTRIVIRQQEVKHLRTKKTKLNSAESS